VAANFAAAKGKKVLIFEKSHRRRMVQLWLHPYKAILHTAAAYDAAKNAKQYGVYAPHYDKISAGKKMEDLAVSRTGAALGEKSLRKMH